MRGHLSFYKKPKNGDVVAAINGGYFDIDDYNKYKCFEGSIADTLDAVSAALMAAGVEDKLIVVLRYDDQVLAKIDLDAYRGMVCLNTKNMN